MWHQAGTLVLLWLHLSRTTLAFLDGNPSPASSDLATLTHTVSLLQQTVGALQQTLGTLQQSETTLRQKVNTMEQSETTLQQTVDTLKQARIAKDSAVTTLQRQVTALQTESGERIYRVPPPPNKKRSQP
jgi:cell division protein FtsB